MADSRVKRVLVYRLGSLGDMLIALPALRLVARAFPAAERRMLTNIPVHAKAPAAQAVLEGTGLIHGYMRYMVGTRSVLELVRLWWSISRWRPEVAVYLAASRGVKVARRDALFLRLCGVKRLVGVPLTEVMQRNALDAATGEYEPEARRLLRNVADLEPGVDVDAVLAEAASWSLELTEAERTTSARAIGDEALAQRMIAVSVGTKVQAKDWGVGNWRALLDETARLWPGRALLLLGAAEESAASEQAAAGWRAEGGGVVVNLCGRLSPRESAAAIARAEIFLGHDSGPMHLAAAIGTPLVAVFAARNLPRVWFPFGTRNRVVYHRTECAGCGLETCVTEQKRCLMSITVGEVLEAVGEVLVSKE